MPILTSPSRRGIRDHSQPRPRWPYWGPPQAWLLLATAGVLVGSFLPWVDTVAGSLTGMAGPGVVTFYAGVLGLAGSLLRRRRPAAYHGGLLAVVAVTLPLWQLARLVRVCPWGGCLPSIGLVLVFGCGVVAGRATWRLLRDAP